MTTLTIPTHLPMKQCENLLRAQLGHRDVQSFKVRDGLITIQHEAKPVSNRIEL